MKKRIVDKGVSAALTIMFVGPLQTDAPVWVLVILTLSVYEIAQWCCRIARREARNNRKEEYVKLNKINGKRWAATRIGWPMKEVS